MNRSVGGAGLRGPHPCFQNKPMPSNSKLLSY